MTCRGAAEDTEKTCGDGVGSGRDGCQSCGRASIIYLLSAFWAGDFLAIRQFERAACS
jgi:hypothetical protein